MLGRTLADFQESDLFGTLSLAKRMRTPTPTAGSVTTFQPRTNMRSEVTVSIREDASGAITSIVLGLAQGLLSRPGEALVLVRRFLSLLPVSEVQTASNLLQVLEATDGPAVEVWRGQQSRHEHPLHRTMLTLENMGHSGRILLIEIKPACPTCHQACILSDEKCSRCWCELPRLGGDDTELATPLLKAVPTNAMKEPAPTPLLLAKPTMMMPVPEGMLATPEDPPSRETGLLLQAVQTRLLGGGIPELQQPAATNQEPEARSQEPGGSAAYPPVARSQEAQVYAPPPPGAASPSSGGADGGRQVPAGPPPLAALRAMPTRRGDDVFSAAPPQPVAVAPPAKPSGGRGVMVMVYGLVVAVAGVAVKLLLHTPLGLGAVAGGALCALVGMVLIIRGR